MGEHNNSRYVSCRVDCAVLECVALFLLRFLAASGTRMSGIWERRLLKSQALYPVVYRITCFVVFVKQFAMNL